ncbi:transposase [Streptomyces sp. ISL-22]|uniref:transposase n=1 Tax=unclassified Streptomyces TaxID=2593676 RepID=UPI001BEA1DD3|nr:MULTISPECIES: transposase [unclassified Streptomyces]MBT2422452.1 transposase [Streptomyces sp. ISL-24]MBT2436503.1 transposase [Streptomyces sp. ISL-22]
MTDAQWARIEPLLPDRTPKRGGRRRDHRQVIDAIAFKFQTGTQWVHLPEKYGKTSLTSLYGPPSAAETPKRRVTVHPCGPRIAGHRHVVQESS